MANQVDLTPATPGNTTGLHAHLPSGQSANVLTNTTDNPTPSKSGTEVTAKISQPPGGPRFSNPSQGANHRGHFSANGIKSGVALYDLPEESAVGAPSMKSVLYLLTALALVFDTLYYHE